MPGGDGAADRTIEVVGRQVAAMGPDVFEIDQAPHDSRLASRNHY
jgi:hypothetical protein